MRPPTNDCSSANLKEFDTALKEYRMYPLQASNVETIQINVGKLCNQCCAHCHVEAGPDRKEIMKREALERCLEIIEISGIETVELTGGSPEMNPGFRWFVEKCSGAGVRAIVRSNLTVMLEEGYEDIPAFLKHNNVAIIASLPCYTRENVDKQRGKGVYDKSVEVLKKLNRIGYGIEDSGYTLNLIYNPGGSFLPGNQPALEKAYRERLREDHQIKFNSLFTITNMPIGRFKTSLCKQGEYGTYMHLLIDAFNPDAAERVMCRNLLSIGWDGSIYDCDFNQMLDMKCNHGAPDHIDGFDARALEHRRIVTAIHCYGCTAGAGSSCSGALDNQS